MKKIYFIICFFIVSLLAKADPQITSIHASPSSGAEIMPGNVNFSITVTRGMLNGQYENVYLIFRLVYANPDGSNIEELTTNSTYTNTNFVNDKLVISLNVNIPAAKVGKVIKYQYTYKHPVNGNLVGPFENFAGYSVVSVLSQEGSFYRNNVDGKMYVFMEGQYRHIYNPTTLNTVFDATYVLQHYNQINYTPSPIGFPIGEPHPSIFWPDPHFTMQDPNITAFVAHNPWTGVGFIVENGQISLNTIIRPIKSATEFDRYHFNWQTFNNYKTTNDFPLIGMTPFPNI